MNTFKYDPLGRRIYKSSSSNTSVFAYDGANLIEEANASGAVVARYAQGSRIDEPLAMLRSSATSYYNADGLGSVTSLANSSGATAQTYTYDSFGNVTASSGSLTNPFQYTGREMDPETGLYYYRARSYDPSTGRFLSEDPIGFKGSGTNFYAYARGNPLSGTDPNGLATLIILSGSIPSNPFGHIAVATTGAGVYSYGTPQPWGSSVDAFLQSQLAERNVQILILDTTPAQEAIIQASMAQDNHGAYSAVLHNCATAVGTALYKAGVGDLSEDDIPILPGLLFNQLFTFPGSQYTWIPQGSVVPSNLGSFNPKH